jgi:hypothetical protein
VDEVRDHVGYVYFLRCRKFNRIKIGYSGYNPDQRFKDLNGAAPGPLERVALMRGPYSLEQELHARFKKYLRKGEEWFSAHHTLLMYIAENARDWNELLREEGEACNAEWQVKRDEQMRLFRLQAKLTDDHYSTCYMAGIDPTEVPVPRVVPPTETPLTKMETPANEKATKKRVKPQRRVRYGPLQVLIDKLKAEESTGGTNQ